MKSILTVLVAALVLTSACELNPETEVDNMPPIPAMGIGTYRLEGDSRYWWQFENNPTRVTFSQPGSSASWSGGGRRRARGRLA